MKKHFEFKYWLSVRLKNIKNQQNSNYNNSEIKKNHEYLWNGRIEKRVSANQISQFTKSSPIIANIFPKILNYKSDIVIIR